MLSGVFVSARSWLFADQRDSLVRNSIYLMASTIVSSILGYIFWIVAARQYTASAVGGAAALVSAMSLASLIGGIGSDQAIVGELPHRRKPEAWSAAITATLVVTGAASLLVGLATASVLALLGHDPHLYRSGAVLFALVAGVVLTSLALLLESVWIAERRAGWMLGFTAIFAAGKLFLLALPIFVLGAALGIFAAWVVMLAITLGTVLLALRRLYGFRPVLAGVWTHAAAMKHALAGNYLITIGDMTPMFLVPVLVAFELSASDTAYFYAAWKIGIFFPVFASAVGSSLFAEGSHLPRRALGMARAGMRLVLPLITVVMVVTIAGGHTVLSFFGPRYAIHAYGLLILLAASAFPDAVVNIYRSVLRVQQRYAMAALIAWGMTVTRVVLTWLLLQPLGIIGAGWAWLITQALGAVAVALDLWFHRDQTGPASGSLEAQSALVVEAHATEGWG